MIKGVRSMSQTVFPRPWRSLLPVAMVVAMTGCMDPPMPSAPPAGVVVEPVVLSYVAVFAPGAAELSRTEAARLRAFALSAHLDDAVSIRITAGGAAAARRRRALIALLPAAAAQLATEEPDGSGDQGLITVEHQVIVPSACLVGPRWAGDQLMPSGCATALSLVRQVERPEDLFHGREMGPAEAEWVARAAERYRQQGGDGDSGGYMSPRDSQSGDSPHGASLPQAATFPGAAPAGVSPGGASGNQGSATTGNAPAAPGQ
jgi:type IV pilus biogenesis protein CpaD/CtpE